MVVRPAVGVFNEARVIIFSFPTVNFTQWFSYFCNLMSHTARQYFSLRPCVVSWNVMKKHMFVPLCYFQSFNSCYSLLHMPLVQTNLFACRIRCWYSMIFSVSLHIKWFTWCRMVTRSVFWLWKMWWSFLVVIIVSGHWGIVLWSLSGVMVVTWCAQILSRVG